MFPLDVPVSSLSSITCLSGYLDVSDASLGKEKSRVTLTLTKVKRTKEAWAHFRATKPTVPTRSACWHASVYSDGPAK